jgi:AcrR family transcriptional regulator
MEAQRTPERTAAPTGRRRARTIGARQRELILSAAARLFMEKGYHATSVREIGDEVGVSQSSLYYHAKSKPQILADLNKRFMERLISEFEGIAARDETPADKVRMVIEQLLTIIAEHQAEVTVVLHERRSLDPRQARGIQRQRDRVDEVIDSILADGVRKGAFRDLDIRLTRLALTGMCNWAYEWYSPRGSFQPKQIAAHFADLLLRGIQADPAG